LTNFATAAAQRFCRHIQPTPNYPVNDDGDRRCPAIQRQKLGDSDRAPRDYAPGTGGALKTPHKDTPDNFLVSL
jgi:hypothetical protein